MRELSVSIGVIRQGDGFVLQRRGDDPAIGAAGLIGAFGGKIEHDETAIQAVSRELSEETSLTPEDMRIMQEKQYDIISDNNLEPVIGHITAFNVEVAVNVAIRALEGSLVKLTDEEVVAHLEEMTPATRYYFENYMEE